MGGFYYSKCVSDQWVDFIIQNVLVTTGWICYYSKCVSDHWVDMLLFKMC